MSRKLGEGRVVKIFKNYAFICDEKVGQVYVPAAAAAVVRPCHDMRNVFTENERVIFTANKQTPPKNDCGYVASSVVKLEDVLEADATIIERNDTYCYATVPIHGRVFVPYSAKNSIHRAWLGKGAEVGGTLKIKYFRQPDIKDCHFVAYTACISENNGTLNHGSNSTTNLKVASSQGGAHRAPERVFRQVGCIVEWNGQRKDSLVYCSQTGLATLPMKNIESFMDLGVWIQYTAVKAPDGHDTTNKGSWIVEAPMDMGMFFEPIPYNMDGTRLQLEVEAVINRVCKSVRAAWMWNDFIGRIYLPPQYFKAGLRPLDCVKITAVWTGHFEDVPWSAVKITELYDNEEVRSKVGQMLKTTDDWKISFVQKSGVTFYCFLEHPVEGSAFAAWTDFTDGEDPPPQGTLCRVTLYRQERDRKHVYRAVLVSPMESGKPIYHHPLYSSTRATQPLTLPSILHRRPNSPHNSGTSSSASSVVSAAAASEPRGYAAVLSNGTRHDSTSNTVPSDHSSSATSIFFPSDAQSGRLSRMDSSLSNGSSVHTVSLSHPPGFPDSISNGVRSVSMEGPPLMMMDHHMRGIWNDGSGAPSPNGALGDKYNGFDEYNWSPSVLSSGGRSAGGVPAVHLSAALHPIESPLPTLPVVHHNNNVINGASALSTVSSVDGDALTHEHLAPGYKQMRGPPYMGTDRADTVDEATQTETMCEQKVMRDIIANAELVKMLMAQFPDHIESLMIISSFNRS